MTNPTPNKVSEPSLTRMGDELASLRASVNKFARAQTALVSNVKALSDEVRALSGAVKAMRSNEARSQLH
jgi:outer membrane murein-binding lipoprotein Lpp